MRLDDLNYNNSPNYLNFCQDVERTIKEIKRDSTNNIDINAIISDSQNQKMNKISFNLSDEWDLKSKAQLVGKPISEYTQEYIENRALDMKNTTIQVTPSFFVGKKDGTFTVYRTYSNEV